MLRNAGVRTLFVGLCSVFMRIVVVVVGGGGGFIVQSVVDQLKDALYPCSYCCLFEVLVKRVDIL